MQSSISTFRKGVALFNQAKPGILLKKEGPQQPEGMVKSTEDALGKQYLLKQPSNAFRPLRWQGTRFALCSFRGLNKVHN